MRRQARGRIIVGRMSPEPPPQLSPELVLVLPPEVAAIARMSLPEPCFSPARSRPLHTLSPRRAASVAALYASVLALTLTPLALLLKTMPAHRAAPGPPAAHGR
jgi:hypothetical protein